jgi:hypothetical protein
LIHQTNIQTAGVIISATNEETIFQKAQPITTQTAKSITLPLIANALNSSIIFIIKKLINKIYKYILVKKI